MDWFIYSFHYPVLHSTNNWEISLCRCSTGGGDTRMSQMNAVPIRTDLWGLPWWLRLCTFNAEGLGSIPGWGTKMPHAVWHSQKQTNKPPNPPKTKTKQQLQRKPTETRISVIVQFIDSKVHTGLPYFIWTIACLLPKNFVLNSRPPLLCKRPISLLWGMEIASHFHTCPENSTEYVRIWGNTQVWINNYSARSV